MQQLEEDHVPDDASLQSVVLRRHRMGMIMAKDHRLAKRASVRVKDLASEPMLMDPRSANPRLMTTSSPPSAHAA